MRDFTHPDVFAAAAAGASWADPETDPTRINWPARQAATAIPFEVIDGRPVRPGPSTGIRYGRNELGHWGPQDCADALVTATVNGERWIVLILRADGHGRALPGGYVDPGETPEAAAERELAEETGLRDLVGSRRTLPARLVPDPRGSDESWMVTVVTVIDLGSFRHLSDLPAPVAGGLDDAAGAEWVPATSYAHLVEHLRTYGPAGGADRLFAAHDELLRDALVMLTEDDFIVGDDEDECPLGDECPGCYLCQPAAPGSSRLRARPALRAPGSVSPAGPVDVAQAVPAVLLMREETSGPASAWPELFSGPAWERLSAERDSGYRGPLDQDGYRVAAGEAYDTLMSMSRLSDLGQLDPADEPAAAAAWAEYERAEQEAEQVYARRALIQYATVEQLEAAVMRRERERADARHAAWEAYVLARQQIASLRPIE